MATRIVYPAPILVSTVSLVHLVPLWASRLSSSDLLTFLPELDLPEYESYDALRSQLLKAITAGSEYFGFA